MPSLPNLKELTRNHLGKTVLALAFLFLLLASPARAALSLEEFEQAVGTNQINLETSYLEGYGSMLGSIVVSLVGCTSPSCPPELRLGALQAVDGMIVAMYTNPPASGTAYVAYLMDNMGLATPVYAQAGTGFSALSPLLPVWRAFRNFAYLLFVIIFVAMGLAIMLRVRLSPQMVVTIQSALPRIVVGLILVTFSYAIVGFMIDLIYVFISLVVLFFGQAGLPIEGVGGLREQFISGGFPQVIGAIFSVMGIAYLGYLGAIGGLVGAALGAITGAGIPGAAAGFVLGALTVLGVLAIIILYILFMLFFELLKAYIGIVIALIFGPIQIALGVIPGFPGFGAWFKGLLANVLVFPAVAFVLLLGRALVQFGSAPNFWSPPMLAGGDFIARGALPLLLGIGTLLIAYQVPPAIKRAMKVEGLGLSVGATLAVPARVIMATAKEVETMKRATETVRGRS